MNQEQFAAERQADWYNLTALLDQAQRNGMQRMPVEAVTDLGRLYRKAASDLAYARAYFPESGTTPYLNQLVARAHTLIYAPEPRRLRSLGQFFWREIPQMIREQMLLVLLSAGIFLAAGALGFFAILYDPNLTEAFVPATLQEFTARPIEGEIWAVEERAAIGTSIMINNIRVGLLAFGLGFTLGIGTVAVLFSNGIMVGALAAHFHQAGLAYPFWALILPHGVLELLAIFLCGAAGFALGWPMVAPGDLPRRAAVSAGARRSIKLVVGSLPFFIIAAIIEGWVTPMGSLSPAGKYVVALVTGIAAAAYLTLAGRRSERASARSGLAPSATGIG